MPKICSVWSASGLHGHRDNPCHRLSDDMEMVDATQCGSCNDASRRDPLHVYAKLGSDVTNSQSDTSSSTHQVNESSLGINRFKQACALTAAQRTSGLIEIDSCRESFRSSAGWCSTDRFHKADQPKLCDRNWHRPSLRADQHPQAL